MATTTAQRQIDKNNSVLIATKAFAPSIGGVETYTALLAHGLATRGVAIALATATPAGLNGDSDSPFPIVRAQTTLDYCKAIRNASLVHIAGPFIKPLLLAILLRKPTVVEHHGYQAACINGVLLQQPDGTQCPGYFLGRRYSECVRCAGPSRITAVGIARVAGTLLRRLLCRFTANVAVSEHVRERLRLPNTTVIYHGIPDPNPNGITGAATPAKGPVFAYVGRLTAEKGLDRLIAAAGKLHDEGRKFELKFIGDGALRGVLEQQATHACVDSSVSFTGMLRGPALERELSRIDAVVMPSVWEETAGLSAIEHMMRGRLVLASDIGGLAEIVGDAGLKFPAGDTEALADRMRTVIEKPSIIGEYGNKARDRAVRLFQQNRMVDDHLRLYDAILNRS